MKSESKKRITALILTAMMVFSMTPLISETGCVYANDLQADQLQPENGIPLVIVRVDESKTTIDDMNGSYQHSVRCEDATVEIIVPEGYSGGYQAAGQAAAPGGELKLDSPGTVELE